MKKILFLILLSVPLCAMSQNAVYGNFGHNFEQFYGGIGIAGDLNVKNLRFMLDANIATRTVGGVRFGGYQLEPKIAYKIGRAYVSAGPYMFNPATRSNKEIEPVQADFGITGAIGVVEEGVVVSIEFGQGFVNMVDDHKSQYAGIMMRIPLSKPF